MKRYSVAFILLFIFLSSCSLVSAPPRKIIFINAHPKLEKVHVKNTPITINLSSCKPIFDRFSVYAQTGEFELTIIPDYFWIDTPCSMIKNSLVKTFSQAGYRVLDFSKNQLSFTLFEFQPVFEKGGLYCKIFARFTLKTSDKTRTMVYQRTKKMERKTQFVSCLNSLVSDMDGRVLIWVFNNLNSKQ